LFREGLISRKEAKKRNRKTISKAAKLVSEGNTVIFFPTGGGKLGKYDWKDGVGFLVDQITDKNTVITFAQVSGISSMDFYRHTASLIRKYYLEIKWLK